MIKRSGIINGIPYIDDLYLDLVIRANGNQRVLDEDELLEALNRKEISEDEYNLANKTKESLLESIINKNNKYMDLDLEEYL